MKAWTDYPFTWLGDTPGCAAPVREVEILSYDGNKYCRIRIGDQEDSIKAGYLYQQEGRFCKVPQVNMTQLLSLPRVE